MTQRLQAPTGVAAQFDIWCKPRRGQANPEVQTNDVWCWLIETGAEPHAAHAAAGQGDKGAPGWCFSRFGQSRTELPDGTLVFVGGEHEDHYDPDFYVYNDVILRRPNGSHEIFGYPEDVFPPTDFHSASLIGDEIFLIGGLRYPGLRRAGTTKVYRLWLSDFSIHPVATRGPSPSWLHNHSAEVQTQPLRIICIGGEVTHDVNGFTVENLTTWAFDPVSATWEAVAIVPCDRWLLMREDETLNDLWWIGQIARDCGPPWHDAFFDRIRRDFDDRGHVVDPDLFHARFSPPLTHSPVVADPFADDMQTHRIVIDGVTVRYVEDMQWIAVTVEGTLGRDKLAVLKRHGLETYSALEGLPYKLVDL